MRQPVLYPWQNSLLTPDSEADPCKVWKKFASPYWHSNQDSSVIQTLAQSLYRMSYPLKRSKEWKS